MSSEVSSYRKLARMDGVARVGKQRAKAVVAVGSVSGSMNACSYWEATCKGSSSSWFGQRKHERLLVLGSNVQRQ